MTIKEKFNIRKSRVNEYLRCVRLCRHMNQDLEQMEQDITSFVDANKVKDVFVCIKSYITTAPATNMNDIGENVYHQIEYCHRFNEKPCPISNCPYHAKHERYWDKERFLRQAMTEKTVAFKRIFDRIK